MERVAFTLAILAAFAASCLAASAPSPGAAGTHVKAASAVDAHLAQEIYLKHSASQLAPPANDEVFLRRVFLDLVGQVPTPSEQTLFALDTDPDRRAKLIDRLLADPRFGQNWGRYWRDVIMYRRLEDRAMIAAGALERLMTDSLNQNIGWDKVAHAMIEGTGNVAEKGETAIILAQSADPNDVAAEVSRIFLGIQIQCAQCHDHPTDRWKREQFHEFAAFFPRIAARPVFNEGRVRGFEVVSVNFEPRFRGPNAQMRGALEHKMPDLKDPTAEGKTMTPAFFATGRKLKTGATDMERRTSIADWMTDREDGWFAKAFVNRIWAELLGEGFYEPVDDLGPDRTCSAPETMQYLADQFALHGYDVKWLYRTILSTKAYARESRPRRNPNQPPFTANCVQRLRGDQLYDVLQSTIGLSADVNRGNFAAGPYARFAGPRFQFNTIFGYDPSQRRDEVTGAIPQALSLMNSSLVNRSINGGDASTMLGKLLAQFDDNDDVIADLYLRCLSREPTKQEIAVCHNHSKSGVPRAEAFEDILWVLVNRTEFLERH